MTFTKLEDNPLSFVRHCLCLKISQFQQKIYTDLVTSKGRLGIVHKDCVEILEVVCALAIWRGMAGVVPSQLFTVRKDVAQQWHEVMGLLLREAIPAVQEELRFDRLRRAYLAYGVVPIFEAVEWPEITKSYPDGSDIYFGDFDATPTWVIEDICREQGPDNLLVLPLPTSD